MKIESIRDCVKILEPIEDFLYDRHCDDNEYNLAACGDDWSMAFELLKRLRKVLQCTSCGKPLPPNPDPNHSPERRACCDVHCYQALSGEESIVYYGGYHDPLPKHRQPDNDDE